jgi:hypothetical protein
MDEVTKYQERLRKMMEDNQRLSSKPIYNPMTHHTDPFEYSEYKRSDHQEDLWDKVVIYGSIISGTAFIGWLIIRTTFTV